MQRLFQENNVILATAVNALFQITITSTCEIAYKKEKLTLSQTYYCRIYKQIAPEYK